MKLRRLKVWKQNFERADRLLTCKSPMVGSCYQSSVWSFSVCRIKEDEYRVRSSYFFLSSILYLLCVQIQCLSMFQIQRREKMSTLHFGSQFILVNDAAKLRYRWRGRGRMLREAGKTFLNIDLFWRVLRDTFLFSRMGHVSGGEPK